MALFDVPKRSTREQDTKLVEKLKTKKATVKSSSLIDQITKAKELVENNLGKYKDDYITIQNEKVLEDYINGCIEVGAVAIDTETTGLDPMQDKIVGVCIYSPFDKAKPAYIPINHVSYITGERVENQLNEEVVAKHLKKLVDTEIIMFNAKFDIRVLRNQLGVYLNCTWDCYLAARLLNENEGAGNNGLKQLHQKYVLEDKEDEFSIKQLFGNISFNKVPINVAYLYGAHDALITWQLYCFQLPYLDMNYIMRTSAREDLQALSWVFHNIEMPCVEVVCDMEDTGVLLDMDYTNNLSLAYNKKLQEKTEQFYALLEDYQEEITQYRLKNKNCRLDNPINIGSPTQIAILLYDILKIEPPEPSQPRGTGEHILAKIDNPLCKAILEYREVQKLLSTYIDKLPEVRNLSDDRIHCNFNQYGADTGRFSSSDPNLQNIPSHNKDIRKMFKATDGYVLMSSDYSQQEPKVMTQMCGDPKMIQAYKEGKDLYAEIAALSFKTTYENCLEFRPDGTTNPEGKERRSQAKSILLGVLYGRGVNSIAEQLGTDVETARRIRDSVFKGFPAIPKFERDSLSMARDLGYVTTLWGRKRRLPALQLPEYEFTWKEGKRPSDLLDFSDEQSDNEDNDVPEAIKRRYLQKLRNAWGSEKRKIFEEANKEGIWIVDNGGKIADAQRQCVNARIQGSAADMSKLAMIKVGKDKRLKELGFRLLIPVHDELIGECPIENAKECKERFSQLMSEAAESKLEIPIKCDVEVTKAWYGEVVEI